MNKYFCLVILSLGSIKLFAQDLNSDLSKVAGQYAESYLQPFIDAYGAGFNSGFFHSASIPSNINPGLHVSFSIQTIGALIPSTEKSFSAEYNTTAVVDTMGQSQTVAAHATVNNAPTIFGDRNPGKAIIDINDTISIAGIYYYPIHQTREYSTFGSVANTNIAPLFVPQLEIGSLLGSEISLRWLPSIHLGAYGNTNYFGVGIRHNLNQYLPMLPLNIAGEFSFQKFSIEDTSGKQYLSASAYSAGVELSKSLGMFVLYGAAQFEVSILTVNYQYNPPSNSNSNNQYQININFDLHGKNTFRLLAGAAINFGSLFINADMNFSNINTINFGIGYNIF